MSFIEINKDFHYSEICYESYQCVHDGIINGKHTQISSITIYNYCINNNITVPDHFAYIKMFLIQTGKKNEVRLI